jgi:hypothetical protein
LFTVATPSQVSNANSRPPQVAHYFCKATASARSSIALEDFQVVEQGLRAYSFDAVITDFATHPLQTDQPRVGWSGGIFDLCLS